MTDKKIICPLLNSECLEDGKLVEVNGKTELHACRFWIRVVGRHPQSGVDVDHFDCAHSWMPVLLIDNTQRQRETGAAVESFRNEMVNANVLNQKLLLKAAKITNTPALECNSENDNN